MTGFMAIVLAFAYRLRGGGFIAMLDFEYRLAWGCALAAAFILLHWDAPDFQYTAILPALAYLSMAFIPHAYCQNIGRWPLPQNKWPSYFLPDLSQAIWDKMPHWLRGIYDMLAMAGVAMFRGSIVFAPYWLTQNYFYGHDVMSSILKACAVLMIGQPIAYAVGWFVPLSLPSLSAKSTEWGEWLNGAVYAASLACL